MSDTITNRENVSASGEFGDGASSADVHNSDCLDAMRAMQENSVDAIVTDPPYGLAFMGAKWDSFGGGSTGNQTIWERQAEARRCAAENDGAPRYGNSHGKRVTRDEMVAFQNAMTPIFAEALRVAKPGAYLLAFGGTRTYHRLACAIEDAGWEIRDCIMWVYGSGFPKSMDVSKAIDKAIGAERTEVIGSRHRNVKPYDDGNGWNANNTTGDYQYMAPATPEAAAWSGWGTCLKPAVEPIVVARKPLDGTVVSNVLKYGTGAINIDACRVPLAADDKLQDGVHHDGKDLDTYKMGWGFKSVDRAPGLGRFPANLIHDGSDEVVSLFPDNVKGGTWNRTAGARPFNNNGNPTEYTSSGSDASVGSAARFFYCAKASRSERGEGNDHPTVKPVALMRWLVRLVCRPGGLVLDPFCGSGSTGVAALQEGMGFIGIERDPHYAEIASERIRENPIQGVLL